MEFGFQTIQEVLSGNYGNTPTEREEKLSYFFRNADDDSKAQLYAKLGTSVENLQDEVVQAVGDYSINGFTLRSEYADGDEEKVKQKIILRKDEINDLIEDWIVQNAGTSISFTDFLNHQDQKAAIKSIIDLSIDDRNLITRWLGLAPSSVNSGIIGASAVVRKLVSAGENIPPDPDDSKKIDDISDADAKQCILLSLLEPLTELNHEEMAKKTGKGLGYPYSGRIIKMNSYNPSTFVNYLSAVTGSNDNLTNQSATQKKNHLNKKTILNYRLSFIREYDGELVELPIFYAGGFEHSKTKGGIEMRPSGRLTSTIKSNTTKFEIDVGYEGSNPSTYRSDVDVTVRISSHSMSTFLQKWFYDGYIDDDKKPIPFTLFDLILFPYLEKDSKGYGRAYKSQYSPSYNRLRLAYSNTFSQQKGRSEDLVNFFDKNVNVLDLAIVDHEFKRDEEGKNHELIINYRGYIQSVLTSPETDILSTTEIKQKRADRDILLKEAIEKDCSLREIQAIQQQLNTLAQADVEDVTSGIITNIYARGIFPQIKGLGIYQLTVDNTLQSDLNNGDLVLLDKIKQKIIDGKGDTIISNASEAKKSSVLTVSAKDIERYNKDISEGTNKIYFFYLADLLDAAILNSSIYKDNSIFDDEINKDVIAQKLRFIFGSFRGPPPSNGGPAPIYNIGDIPISVEFFLNWYEQNVTKKELYIYPCLSFIRDITEKVVTNLLNEFCFGQLEEAKVLVRTSFFTGTKIGDKEPIFEIAKNDYENDDKASLRSPIDLDNSDKNNFPLIRTQFDKNVSDYTNYCAIYTRDNRSNSLNIAKNVEIPNFKYDYPEKFFGAETIAFSRTSQQGLRESRYARNGGSGITMLAGVYNASIKLTHPLNFIYPGQFFEISIDDGGNYINLPNGTTVSIFNELGLNGYYSVTKATHKLNMKNRSNQVTIDGIWVGSKSPYEARLTSGKKSITNPNQKQCTDLLNLSQEIGVRSLSQDFRIADEVASITGTPPPSTPAPTPTPQQTQPGGQTTTAPPPAKPKPITPQNAPTPKVGTGNSSAGGINLD